MKTHPPLLVGVRCEGTAFFRCASYALLCLAVGDPSDWPVSATDAWEAIPERVLFDERPRFDPVSAVPRRDLPVMQGNPRPFRMTNVARTQGPRDLRAPRSPGDQVAGRLEVTGGGGTQVFDVGEEALHEGILLGRYDDRCVGSELLADPNISRVHVLIVQVGGRLVAVDIASTNGTFVDGDPLLRALRL